MGQMAAQIRFHDFFQVVAGKDTNHLPKGERVLNGASIVSRAILPHLPGEPIAIRG
jgi:hypothetical protein